MAIELPEPRDIPGFYDIEARKALRYTASQMREHEARVRAEALREAYDAMFELKGCKVTRFDAQTAIRSLIDKGSNPCKCRYALEGRGLAPRCIAGCQLKRNHFEVDA